MIYFKSYLKGAATFIIVFSIIHTILGLLSGNAIDTGAVNSSLVLGLAGPLALGINRREKNAV